MRRLLVVTAVRRGLSRTAVGTPAGAVALGVCKERNDNNKRECANPAQVHLQFILSYKPGAQLGVLRGTVHELSRPADRRQLGDS